MSMPGKPDECSKLLQQGPKPQPYFDVSERLHSSQNAITKGLMGVSCRRVLDIDDIAELFNCSREKVKRMARSGELPAFKFGKHWYVLRNDLERFLSDKVESNRHLRRAQEVSP
jgi:excisionase family DNA binding protein